LISNKSFHFQSHENHSLIQNLISRETFSFPPALSVSRNVSFVPQKRIKGSNFVKFI
jgi:hypothetical protein